MSEPCRGCGAILDCSDLEDTYSLQSTPLPYSLECPPGFDCNQVQKISLTCCGHVFTVQIPLGADFGLRSYLISQLIAECQRAWLGCPRDCPNPPCEIPCPNPPCDETKFFYNRPQTCCVECAGQLPFCATVPAGTFIGNTQEEADTEAYQLACQLAQAHKLCLGDIPNRCCEGSAYLETIVATGGSLAVAPANNFWSITGSLPTGLTFAGGSTSDPFVIISGTPSAGGTFTFTVRITTPNGDTMAKTYAICVIEITPVIATATVGVAYADMPIVTPCAGPISYSIVSGSLPPGLTLDPVSGVISGTPTTIGTYTFEIGVTTA